MHYINFEKLEIDLRDFKDYCGLLTEYGCSDEYLDSQVSDVAQKLKEFLKSANKKTDELIYS